MANGTELIAFTGSNSDELHNSKNTKKTGISPSSAGALSVNQAPYLAQIDEKSVVNTG